MIRKVNYKGIDYHRILVQPISSDKNLMKMENDNTITFVVADNANKAQIKEAFEKIYQVSVRKVNTLNCIGKNKKAYIRLAND